MYPSTLSAQQPLVREGSGAGRRLSSAVQMDSERISLYQSIVSQLEDDGFHGAAAAVAQTTMIRALPA